MVLVDNENLLHS